MSADSLTGQLPEIERLFIKSGVAAPREVPLDSPPFSEFDSEFALNRFYSQYSHAEGWFGNSFLRFDTVSEVKDHTARVQEFFKSPKVVFGGNGGGEYFGVRSIRAQEPEFVVIPSVGAEDDIYAIGTWDNFLTSLMTGEYLP